MKYFQTTADPREERKKITWDEFSEHTQRKFPYVQIKENLKPSYYAVCPNCHNPIQLIGLARKTSIAAYGKHAGKTIEGLRPWNQMKYEYCFLGVKGAKRDPDNEEIRFLIIDDEVIALYDLLREQFDRVVYIVSMALGIRATGNFWRQALRRYLVSQAYCYKWLTSANLPYIFADFGLSHAYLWNVKIKKSSQLHEGLKENHNLLVSSADKNGYCSWKPLNEPLYLIFRFYNHKYKSSERDNLVEYLQFCIDNEQTGETIFETTLSFDELEFQNIRFHGNNERRQQWLLDIAKEEMKGLKKQN